MSNKDYRIIGLSIKNLRNIHAADLDFDGKNFVEIRGENRAGKSTVIDALEFALRGGKSIPPDVVTRGKKKAVIVLKIGDYKITRVIQDNGKPSLSILNKGMTQKKPQAFLDELAGEFIDPMEFAGLSGPEMKKQLMTHLGLDFSEVDREIGAAEHERLLLTREIKEMGAPQEAEKVENKSVTDLIKSRDDDLAFNNAQDEKQRAMDTFLENLEDFKVEKDDWAKKISELKNTLNEYETKEKECEQHIANMTKSQSEIPKPEPKKSLFAIDNEIEGVEEHNRKADEYEKYLESQERYDKKKEKHESQNDRIKELREQKDDMLKKADMPIKGLSITDTGLSFNDDSRENWSDSQCIKISTHISAVLAKDLKVMYIDRGESLDTKSRGEIIKFAKDNDFLVIVGIVDDTYDSKGENVILLKEGKVLKTK